jgi:hypothetical protein
MPFLERSSTAVTVDGTDIFALILAIPFVIVPGIFWRSAEKWPLCDVLLLSRASEVIHWVGLVLELPQSVIFTSAVMQSGLGKSSPASKGCNE